MSSDLYQLLAVALRVPKLLSGDGPSAHLRTTVTEAIETRDENDACVLLASLAP